jgi:ABC-type nitrate/sulfonate/bicarbonate transport system substrate-binding protein
LPGIRCGPGFAAYQTSGGDLEHSEAGFQSYFTSFDQSSYCFLFLWLNRGNLYAADKIVADFGGLGAFQSTTWVAKDLKIFDKYGLDVDLVMITGGARSVAALWVEHSVFNRLGNNADSGVGPKLGSRHHRGRLQSFSVFFVSKPEIKSPKELRGKNWQY